MGLHFCTGMPEELQLPEKTATNEDSYYPEYMGGTGLDEIGWVAPLPSLRVIDSSLQSPFREGESHVLTPGGYMRCRI